MTVRSYGERSTLVTAGLRDGDNVVLAGVHTVYAGQRVKPIKPLFADEEGGASATGGAAAAAGTAAAR